MERRAHHLIARYYDAISPVLMSPARRRAGTMHQEIWGPGVTDRDAALAYATGLVEAAIAPALAGGDAGAKPLVLDLGCGVGGAATRLASRLDIRVVGLTLSLVQAASMRSRAGRLGVGANCHVVIADYTRPPFRAGAVAAYALESFTHATDPARWLARIASQLAPGGRLVVFDDFIAEASAAALPGRDALIDRFRRGWLLPSLMTRAEFLAFATAAGFSLIEDTDLSPYLPPVTAPGRLIKRLGARLSLPGPMFGAISGGAALQLCQDKGWIEKRFFVFACSAPAQGL